MSFSSDACHRRCQIPESPDGGRTSPDNRASNGEARPDNLLASVDQGFLTGTAPHQLEVIQVVWAYEHPIDFDGLQRFHHTRSPA